MMIIPILLAGGSGHRLWPLSRKNCPKVFMHLVEDASLLQTTLHRVRAIPGNDSPIIIGNLQCQASFMKQLDAINQKATLIFERTQCNTAPAAAIAARYAMSVHGDPLLLILPVDHHIPDPAKFAAMITKAAQIAELPKLVTFGVKPQWAETGYGYIEIGEKIEPASGPCYVIKTFVEKPSADRAATLLQSDLFFWNSGIFLCKASCFLQELKTYSPEVYSASEGAMHSLQSTHAGFIVDENSMTSCPHISLDNAIFEQTHDAVMVPFVGEWADLGDWDALYACGKKDKQGNVMSSNVLAFDTKNALLFSNQQLLVTSGMRDCIIIVTSDAILVARRDKKQDIKKIVNYLLDKKQGQSLSFSTSSHPWGVCEGIEGHAAYQWRLLTIDPNQELCVHTNAQHIKHWIIVEGAARCTDGSAIHPLSKHTCMTLLEPDNDYTVHNVGTGPLVLIELSTRRD